MTDYKRSTGSSGTLMIRDTGSTVEFWIESASGTFNHQLPWSYVVDGVASSWRDFDFIGGAWRKLGSISVTKDSTVSLRIGDSGTSGLGGPTTLTANIERATIPPAPTMNLISSANYDHDSAFVNADGNGSGGLPILQWTVAWSTNPDFTQFSKDLDLDTGTGLVTGLARGTTYYFWSRVRNAKGWSAYSNRVWIKTDNVPAAPSAVSLTNKKGTSVTTSFTDNANNGAAITDHQIGYGTSSTTAQNIKTLGTSRTANITGLAPGTKYYFWARAKNIVGWSSWGTRSEMTTVSGTWVKVGTTWKLCVPYVKVNGVWKAATPWVRIYGVWKETG